MAEVVWQAFPPRQITGSPYKFYGYVGRGKIECHCHDRAYPAAIRNGAGNPNGTHFSMEAAQRCAERAARHRNRQEAADAKTHL